MAGCSTCGKSGSTGTSKSYTPAKKSYINRNLQGGRPSGASGNFGSPKVSAKFSGRGK